MNENAGTISIPVIRSGGTANAVTINYVTTAGSATDGPDYTGTQTGTLNFADGVSTGNIIIPITNDSVSETLENFTVKLTSANNFAVIGSVDTVTVTINDDDSNGTIGFASATQGVIEGALTVTLNLTRTGGTSGAVSATYNTANGTAVAPGDYTAVNNGTVNFADGQATAQIIITLVNDNVQEPSETFTVTLSSPTGGAILGTATTTVTITDDDTAVPTGLLINEVSIDPPSNNTPYQFVEIRGTPGTLLDNVYLLSIEGELSGTARNPGQIKLRIDLTGAVIGSNGLLVVGAATGGFDRTSFEPGTAYFGTTDLDQNKTGFISDSLTVTLAYREPSGAVVPALSTDLDTDNVIGSNGLGTLEGLPSNVTVLDAIANLDGTTADVGYFAKIAPLGTNADPLPASALVRLPGNTTPFSAAAFYYGRLVDTAGTGKPNADLRHGRRHTIGELPRGRHPHAGQSQRPVVADTTPPTVLSAVFDPRLGQKIVLTFSENVGAGVVATDFTLTNTTTNTPITLVLNDVSLDGKTVTLTFNNTGGLKSFILQNGHYTIKALAGQIADTVGNTLVADYTSGFSFINGDLNFSGNVNFDDLVPLAQHYNAASDYAGGDANYDGIVNFDDLVPLAQNYNLTAPASFAAGWAAAQASLRPAVAPTKVTATKKESPAALVFTTPVVAPATTTTFSTGKRIA